MIGVLAVQGNFTQHQQILKKLDEPSIQVKYPSQLEGCDALILPGGESTTISKIIDQNQLREPLIDFAKKKSILGTCAGMILLSSSPTTKHMKPLNILNIQVDRNSWGRQIDSFHSVISISIDKNIHQYEATFIRAPKIIFTANNIDILASYKDEAVMVSDGQHLATTFHPEINNNLLIHKYFIKISHAKTFSNAI